MPLTKAGLAELADHVQRSFPGLSADRREELVQDAVTTALEEGPPDPESALLDRAKAAVPALRNSDLNRLRRGGRISQRGVATGEPLPRVRRVKKRPHVPKGLMPMLDAEAQRLVPLTQGELPDPATVAAAKRLFLEVIEPAMMAHPVSPSGLRSIRAAHNLAFDEPPELAWASIMKEEIQRAQRGLLEKKLAAASASPSDPGTVDWSVEVTKTAAGEEAYPDLPQHARLQLVPIRSYKRRGIVTVEAEAQYEGKLITTVFVDGTYGDVPPSVVGTTLAEHAAGVLLQALRRAAELGCGPLPDYVMDLELIALLIERAGFQGGGGARGRLSGPSLRRLLADPCALADEVEAFGSRHVERLQDDEADRAEAGYREIANGIRARGGCRLKAGLPGQG